MTADPAGAGGHLPFAFARDHQVILTAGRLILGPGGGAAALAEVRRAAGAPLAVEEVDAAAFARLLDAHYSTAAGQAGDTGADIAFDLEETETGARVQDLLEDAAEAPVIELVNQLLRRAVRAGASDLHVEPLRDGIRARMRLDGTLYPILEREDVPVRRIVSRLKVMAGLDTSETRLPQDGRIALRFGGRAIDLRFSSLPGQHGERLVLRILDRQAGIRPLDDLGLSPAQAAHLVLSSLHANGTLGAVTRLRDLGLDDYLIASTLRGVPPHQPLRRIAAGEVAPEELARVLGDL